MLLAVDIGNTSIKFGIFEAERLASKFSIPTNRKATAEDLQSAVDGRLSDQIRTVLVCSVVPELALEFASFARLTFGVDPVFVDNSFDLGLRINYAPVESLGTDRLVAAFAAVELHASPIIVCSMGTATTIDVVNRDREFAGGVIAPGMDALAEALHIKAPRLPRIDVVRPPRVVGNSTADVLRSGIYHGYVSMVEGLIARIRSESGVVNVVGTGGNATRLADEFSGLLTIEQDLVLKGLEILSRRG